MSAELKPWVDGKPLTPGWYNTKHKHRGQEIFLYWNGRDWFASESTNGIYGGHRFDECRLYLAAPSQPAEQAELEQPRYRPVFDHRGRHTGYVFENPECIAAAAAEPVAQAAQQPDGYGDTEFGYTFAGIQLEEGDKRLATMIVRALGNDHPAMNDLVSLLFRARSASHPAAEQAAPKDHEIAKLVNELRDIAIKYHDHQSLRDRIQHVILDPLKAARRPVRELTDEVIQFIYQEETGFCMHSGHGSDIALMDFARGIERAVREPQP